MKANIRFDHELLAIESEHHVHAMLELTAPSVEPDKTRPPLHLALVLDRSGSMQGAKLAYTKHAAKALIRRLAATDEVAVVAYDDEINLLRSMTPVDVAEVSAAIDSVYPRGSTNLSGGWLKGTEELRRAGDDGPRKLLLLTDGLANQGVTDPKALVEMTRGAATDRIGTTTIGFGAGFNEELLTAMADGGGGNSHYISSPEDAPAIFAQEFDDLTSLVAQNVSVEIRPSSEVKVLGVLNDYEATPVVGGLQLNLGDAYSDEARRVVFELHIPQLAALGVTKVADVVLRYTSIGNEISMHELSLPLKVNMVSTDEAAAAGPNQEVVEEVLILKATRAQEEARKRANEGNFGEAQALLRATAEELRSNAVNSKRAQELLEDAEFMDGMTFSASPETWDSHASKSAHFRAWNKQRGRQPRPSPDERKDGG